MTHGFMLTVGVFIHRDGEKESEYNQQWWLNQLDALIKKAAGDIASHLCPLVCVSVSVCQRERVSTCVHVCVCTQMSVSNKAAGGVCWGASLCLPTPPTHPVRVTDCAAMMCPLAKPTASLFSRSISPHSLCFFVYFTHFSSAFLIISLLHCR